MPKDASQTKIQESAPANERPVDLARYKDLEGVTMKKLTFGLWFIEHKQFFYRLITTVLMVIGGVSWIYTLVSFAYYFAIGTKQDDLMLRQLVKTKSFDHEYVKQIVAHSLTVAPVTMIEAGAARGLVRYDFAAEITNTNARYWGEFDYAFAVDGQETKTSHTFVLPGESKYLLGLGEEFEGRPISANLAISNLAWHRVDAKLTDDWAAYRNERLAVSVSDIKFTPPRTSGLSERLNVSQLDFTAANNSPYNYWQANFIILLWNRGQLAGINRYNLDRFRSGETRSVTLSWPGTVARADAIEISPEIDIMDKNNYFKFEASEQAPAEAPR